MQKTYGLIGYPLGHSFSASFFAEKFQRETIDAEYLNFAIEDIDQLPSVLDAHPSLSGFNVTIPYKQSVMRFLDDISLEAKAIGAVNVVKVTHTEDGLRRLVGYNSDVVGFTRSLRPLLQPAHCRALVLGTGGASRAVVYGLRQMGIAPTYVSRTPASNRITYAQLSPVVMQSHTVVVNCTPLGMFPKIESAPDIPYTFLTPNHLLFDLVYNPEETLFLKRGREQGAVTKNGLEMLHLQAIESWRIWQS